MKSMNVKRHQHGMTIIEIMVALVLGLILLGGILQVYLGSKTTYRFSEALGRLQEDSRLAFDLIAKDIRMAGYVPCGPVETIASVLIDEPGDNDWWIPFFNEPLRGYEGSVSTFPAVINDAALDTSSDALVVLRGGSRQASVRRYDDANGRFILQRDLGADWVADGKLMIACDQDHASLFQAGAVDVGADPSVTGNVTRISTATGTVQPGNCTTQLGPPGPATCTASDSNGSTAYTFGEDSFIADVEGVIYYIRDSSTGNGRALYREFVNVNNAGTISLTSDSEELIGGVESMQIEYGLDLDGDDSIADRYVTADNVNADEWTDVVTVRIGLLFASDDGVIRLPDTKVYNVAGTTIAPTGVTGDLNHVSDKRIRLATTTLVQVRN